MKPDALRRPLKAGLFLTAGAVVTAAMLVMIGGAQHPFARKARLRTSFRDTTGLSIGAPVRLGGLDVGTVREIQFAPTLGVREVSVTLAIEARYLDRIRADSRATLAPKGLLGDATIAISLGTADAAPLGDGAFLPSEDNQTVSEMVGSLNEGISEVRALSKGLRERLDDVVTPEMGRDLARLARAAADSAEALQHGDGLAHALLFDPELAATARSIARNADRSAGALATAITRVDRIAAAVEGGSGTLHRLVSRDDAGPILEDAQRAARELADAATAIRQQPGPLHTLVYGPDADALVENLTALSRTLKKVGEDVAAGRGTVGALLEDPTVYEDLKIILRGVKRNTLLKSLVRFTIERDRLRQEGGAR